MEYFIELKGINLKRTLFCGQSFRWRELSDNLYFGIAASKEVKVKAENNGITIINANEEDIPFWENYFDAKTDYDKLLRKFSEDETLKTICEATAGIRVLRQPPFETLISFIISQNNNISRITGIIARLCESFGEKTENGRAFPKAEALASLSEEALAPLKAGFRARYVLDGAQRVASGKTDLEALYSLSAADAKKELLKIKGVGDKVADCVLLFAYSKTEAVPKDVWIKRGLAKYFPDGLPDCVGEHAGIAQQYLFEYIRTECISVYKG